MGVCIFGSTRAHATTFPPWTTTPGQTVVSIEFDDGTANQYVTRPILASHNMKATFFVNSATTMFSSHMTWSQIHELYSDGNEIGGHTLDHPHLAQIAPEEAAREICNDRVNLLNQGFQPTDFAYPFGEYDSAVLSIVKQCGYNSARYVNGIRSPSCEEELICPFAESIPPPEPYVTRTPRNILATDSPATIESYVTQAQQNGGGWVQLVFHNICSGCDTYATTESDFAAVLNWLATQQKTTTATVQQVIGGPLQPAVAGPAPVNLPGPNVLHNPSLEEESPNSPGVPAGWDTTTFGTNTATWTRTTDAHSGNHAERLDVTSFTSGGARLLSHQDQGQYAPTPTVGDNYDVNAYYKSTAPVLFYVYTRDQTGEWNFWTTSGFLPASSSWKKGTFTTAPIPNGTTGISVGLGLQHVGSVTMDDFSLLDRGVIPPPTNVLSNPGLENLPANGGDPVCWSRVLNNGAGGTGPTGTWAHTTESHSGNNAELATATADPEGDMKLVSQQDSTLLNPTLSSATASASGGQLGAGLYYYEITATSAYGETLPSNEASATTTGTSGSVVLKWPAVKNATGYKVYRAGASGQETLLASVGAVTSYTDTGSAAPGTTRPPSSNTASKVPPCAPPATIGDAYQGSAWYKSSAGASVRLIVYYRDATGNWVFWKTQTVPASTTWTQASIVTEAVPPGATALSFGVSLYSVGTLDADDLSLGDATAANASDPPPCGSDVCDTTPPASSASSPASSTSGSLAVSYSAADNPGGSGLARVDLYVKGPGDLGYALAASSSGSATSGVFSYAALEGDGSYSFYTLATDAAGNTETAPMSAETTTLVDTTPPTSTASAPVASNSAALTVAYSAADSTSGLARVDLYAQAPEQIGYSLVASDTSGSTSGSFSYSAAAGDGSYSFYTVATDRAGNVQVAPASPDATTQLDTVAPSSSASARAISGSTSLTIFYTAADNGGGSGLSHVDLYAQAPGQSGYNLVASRSRSTGNINYEATAGDGSYSFYTVATDQAGNAQAAPSTPNTTTLLDTVSPTSKASAPASGTYGAIPVSYTAADNGGGSGLAEVDLYVQGPGQSEYSLVASDTSGYASGNFSYTPSAGDGSYSFYTVATDQAENVQATPATPDAATTYTLDTTPPTSQASAQATDFASSFTVSYTAADNEGGSGLAKVDLYAKAPGQSSYTKAASTTSANSSGSFSYTAAGGNGSYSFYTIATDQAANVQATPATPDATTSVIVDATPPSSSASSPALSASASLSVSYSAADNEGGSGLAKVDLYAKAPGQSSYTKVASTTSANSSGSFSYTAAGGDGSYSFYTTATDQAANVQATPATPNATTLLDTTPPTSNASSPALSSSTSLSVSYTASDSSGGSGLAKVDLYAKGPGQSSYTKVASDTSGSPSGSFSYTASAGDGSYNFYTLATDKAGNVQAVPGSPNATTLLDTAPPTSNASSPALSASTSFSVSYTASDNSGGSGLAKVDLYAKAPGQSAYAKVASDTSGSSSGSFSYTAGAGSGSYSFYTLATDKAGNVQAAPSTPNATTLLDTAAPTSKASAPASATYPPIVVSYTASDNSGGAGLAKVDLYVEGPGQSSYTKVASDSSGSSSGSFSYSPSLGNGNYSFYTRATDKAGNVQAAPAKADATTSYKLDTTAPTSTATAPTYSTIATVSVSYTASDNGGGSGLASVELWARPPGAGSYVKAATNTGSGAAGSFSYTAAGGEGSYAFYTIAVDLAGNREASPNTPDATTMLDTLAPSAFQMTSPGGYLRATVKPSLSSAPTDGGSGMASVTYQYRVSGTTNPWSTACTAAAPPWSCSWNTATKTTPDGLYDLLALADDKAGNTTVASNTPLAGITIDNTKPTAGSISTTNVSGGTKGKAEPGDSATFTYSEAMSPGSILSGWTGASTAVQVRLVAGKGPKPTTLTVWNSAGTVQLALAQSLELGGNYVPPGGAIFNATMVKNGAAITVTLGSLVSGSVLPAPVVGGTLTWIPDGTATDLAGNTCSPTSASAPGPAF